MSNMVKTVVASLVVGLSIVDNAHATTVDLQNAAQSEASLLHQWTFEGAEASTAGLDKKGTLNLVETLLGGGPSRIVYDVDGYDATSNAVSTYREGKNGSTKSHAFVSNGNTTLGSAMSFEVIVKTGVVPISDDGYDLGYILSNRNWQLPGDNSKRGYFLWQGSENRSGDSFSTMIGAWGEANENEILASLAEDNWYYVAGSYSISDGQTTINNYVADLTGGETTLTHTGKTVIGTYMDGAETLGVGMRYEGWQEAFPGLLDEVYVYNDVLSAQTFQAHLDELQIPEPATMSLLLVGGLGLITRRRRNK